jgi:hypothetical protein
VCVTSCPTRDAPCVTQTRGPKAQQICNLFYLLWPAQSLLAMAEAKDAKSTNPSSIGVEANSSVRVFSWSKWLVLTAISATIFYYFGHRSAQLKAASITPTKILDARIGFTPDTAYAALRDLGTTGRQIYAEMNKVDFIIVPVLMRLLFLNTLPSKSPTRAQLRDVLMTICSVGDVVENICVLVLLRTYPRRLNTLAWVCCVGNVVKYSASCAGLLTVVFEAGLSIKEAIGGTLKSKQQ